MGDSFEAWSRRGDCFGAWVSKSAGGVASNLTEGSHKRTKEKKRKEIKRERRKRAKEPFKKENKRGKYAGISTASKGYRPASRPLSLFLPQSPARSSSSTVPSFTPQSSLYKSDYFAGFPRLSNNPAGMLAINRPTLLQSRFNHLAGFNGVRKKSVPPPPAPALNPSAEPSLLVPIFSPLILGSEATVRL